MADRSAALDALTTQSFPFVLVASKCDIRNNDGPFEPVLDNYEIHRTSPESPRSQKMCIALVLRSVIGNKYGEFAAPVYSPSVPPHLHGPNLVKAGTRREEKEKEGPEKNFKHTSTKTARSRTQERSTLPLVLGAAWNLAFACASWCSADPQWKRGVS